jgi:hypothetical protein
MDRRQQLRSQFLIDSFGQFDLASLPEEALSFPYRYLLTGDVEAKLGLLLNEAARLYKIMSESPDVEFESARIKEQAGEDA